MKIILELTNIEARHFLLKPESYANFDLPSYFDFGPVLSGLSATIGNHRLSDIAEPDPSRNNRPMRPSDFDDVNYTLLNNKDGKYAWRPFELIHPALYVLLVNEITEPAAWAEIQARFAQFQADDKIVCLSMPVVSETEQSDKAEQVSAWWQQVEQGSIELALEFDYVAHTDISDCYGSVYTHSIPWALHDKANAKANRSSTLLGNRVDGLVQGMSNGQTNGIPQGSTIMDFVAEIVLGYADLLLSQKLAELGIDNYKILRYRDDYRIFVNSPQDAEKILKALTEILIDLGLRLNAQKTLISDNVVRDSVKPEKLYWMVNGKTSRNLREHLQILHEFAEKFPNNGTLKKLLTEYQDRIKNLRGTPENLFVMSGIIADIAIKNPASFSICSAILSKFISLMANDADKNRVVQSIQRKFEQIPNTGLLQLWLQRITAKAHLDTTFTEPLCQKLDNVAVTIWNSQWLQQAYRNIVDSAQIFDQTKFDDLDTVISADEVALFVSAGYY